MATDRSSLVLTCFLVLCGCSESEPSVVDDQSWDDLSSEQRVAHLEQKLADNLETLENTGDGATWHEAAGEAVRALSLLRVERSPEDREAYIELEAEVERLTDNPPFFAR